MIETSIQFERRYSVQFIERLGDGKDGRVFKTSDGHAVKLLFDPDHYRRELRAYQILLRRDIDALDGFQIPRLVRSDDSLHAIEMTVVRPPFLLDFVSTYTPEEYARLAFTDEVLDERESHWAEIFADRWPAVLALRAAFARETGLLLLDLSLNNVKFDGA